MLDEIQATLPKGMVIDRQLFRQSDFIERAVDNVEVALRDGGILVVIVVLVFLANVRAARSSRWRRSRCRWSSPCWCCKAWG